jgi:hypothetical protein
MGDVMTYIRADKERIEQILANSFLLEEESEKLGLRADKSWRSLYILFEGPEYEYSEPKTWLGKGILGATFVEADPKKDYFDLPLGILSPEEVRFVVPLFQEVSDEDLVRMIDTFPEEEFLYRGHKYLLSYFNEIKAYYEEASRHRQGMIVWLH